MSLSDDYNTDMSATRLEDREVELLLSGSAASSAEMAELAQFVALLSADAEPPQDVSFMASSLAAVARSSGRTRKRGFRHVAVVVSATVMLLGLSGIAMAANGSSPGDALYGIDRALEGLGIGDGGIEERIQEFEALIERGEEKEAFEFLSDIAADGTEPEAAAAARRLQVATGAELPASEANTPPEAVDPGAPARENPASQPVTPETVPDAPADDPDESSGSEGNTDDSNGHGKAVGQSDDAQPPGQEKKENNGQGNTSNDNAPNDSSAEDQGQGNAVGQSDDTQPPGQEKQPPGQESQDNGQGNANGPGENNGQGNANGPGQNNGQGNANEPD